MTRKLVLSGLIFLTLCLAAVAGCGAPAPTPEPTPTATPTPTPTPTPTETPTPTAPPLDLPAQFVLSTANPGPTELAEKMAEIVTANTAMEVVVEKVRSTGDAQMRIADAAGVLTITDEGCVPCHRVAMWSTAQNYYDGSNHTVAGTVGILEPDRGNLRALFCGDGTVSAEKLAIQTLPGSGIETVADLKGKRVYAEYTGVRFVAPLMDVILQANGMTREDIEWMVFPSSDGAYEDLAAGNADAVFYVIGSGAEGIAKSQGLYLVPLSEETQQAVAAAEYGFQAMEWPVDDALPGTAATLILSAPRVLWVPSQCGDDTAYAFTRAIIENLDELQAGAELGAGFTLENALAQWTFPYHPGAIKYFEEIGLWTAEMDAKQAALLERWSAAK